MSRADGSFVALGLSADVDYEVVLAVDACKESLATSVRLGAGERRLDHRVVASECAR